ncbi:Hsp33 family molecular chaperone HslO [Aliikangiella maris]|uniref:Hsp33 family molecular chaperone HslO n=2 Tax=Aliikangiella maris TaxID=3162458 RepID=A0ABV3MTC3_9GAMM
MSDTIHRFLFDNDGIRGQLVKLEESAQRLINGHQYPPFIADLLFQAATINALLATSLKFEGRVSLQLQSSGPLKMLIVQTTHELDYRGLARFDEETDFTDFCFKDIVSQGHLAITIEPTQGKRYQGIVPLDGETLTQCVENYFMQSEQLATRIWIFTNETQTCGLLLQALPDMQDEKSFEHLGYLASTLSQAEALSESAATLFHRLFHQESVQYLSVNEVHFVCSCSQQKMLDSLNLLPKSEINEILSEEGFIEIKCEFCLDQFQFSEFEIKAHQKASQQVNSNTTHH